MFDFSISFSKKINTSRYRNKGKGDDTKKPVRPASEVFKYRKKLTKKDILDRIYTDVEEDSVDDFVNNLIIDIHEKFISDNLKRGEAICISGFGILAINENSKLFNEAFSNIGVVMSTNNKELLNDYIDSVRDEVVQKCYAKDVQKRKEVTIRKRNKKLYTEYHQKYGKAYADVAMVSIAGMKAVKFNQEDEDHLQKLYNQDD